MSIQTLPAPTPNQAPVLPSPTESGNRARRKANGYLGKYVGMFFGATNPIYLPLDRPVWQLSIYFQMYSIGPVPLGFVDVDATTGDVIPLTDEYVSQLQIRAHAVTECHPSAATPPR